MKAILALLRRAEPITADLSAALAELPADNGAAAVVTLEQERRTLLLDGAEDRALDVVDRKLAAAVRERDRMAAVREELTQRLAAAEAQERADALAVERDAAEVEATAVLAAFAKRYDAVTAELIDLASRLEKAEAKVVEANRKMEAAGFDDRIAPVEPRLAPLAVPLMWTRRFVHAATFERGHRP